MLFVVVWSLSSVQFFATPWTVACQFPLSIVFPKQEYWSGFPFSSPGNLINLGTELANLALAGGFFAADPCGKPVITDIINYLK